MSDIGGALQVKAFFGTDPSSLKLPPRQVSRIARIFILLRDRQNLARRVSNDMSLENMKNRVWKMNQFLFPTLIFHSHFEDPVRKSSVCVRVCLPGRLVAP